MARILFIDEDIGLLETLYDYLKEVGGHEVISASGPREALRLVTRLKGAIDLVILDIMMPTDGMYKPEEASLGLTTGALLLETLRPMLPGTPFIVLTAIARQEVKLRLLALGIGPEFYLEKPVGGKALLSKVNEALAT